MSKNELEWGTCNHIQIFHLGGVYRRLDGRKLRFTAPLTRRVKQNFRPYNRRYTSQIKILNTVIP